jgi:acetylornithine aminotransferase
MTLAKGLANGVPLGACLAAGPAADEFTPGKHGSTFGGNPLACVAAETTLQIIEDEGLLANALAIGARIREGLASRLAGVSAVREIRGKGLMIGIELDRPCGDIVSLGLEAGLLVNVTAERVVRLLPPLILSAAEADTLADGLAGIIRAFVRTEEPAAVAG